MLARVKPFTPDDLVACYRRGVFPMAESRDDEGFFIVDPEWRCIFPLDKFHVPRRLARTLRSGRFSFTVDRDFAAVLDGCAAPGPDREDTWINPDIRTLYLEMHARGLAHSVEARIDGELAGGLYGVAIGGAFFGESMYSLATDASKAALVHLAARLRRGGFKLLDAQFVLIQPAASMRQWRRTSRADMWPFANTPGRSRNRASCFSRAASTRPRIDALGSAVCSEVSSPVPREGTSTCRSMRSSSGPEIRAV